METTTNKATINTTGEGTGLTTVINQGKRKKSYASKSKVWDHFTKIKKEGGGLSDQATCNYCKHLLRCPSANGTTSLNRHLDRCPKFENNRDPTQQILRFGGDNCVVNNWKFDQEVCRNELARMVIVEELPFSFVEKEGFKRFLSVLQPKFQLVSRTTIRKDCINIFETERNKLKVIFESSASRICLTTDLWTSIQNLGYMCLTAHYIDKDWKLQKKIINFRVIPTPHRGEIIAQAVETCLLEWGIEKLCTLTVDNASSNDVAALSLKRRFNKRNGLLLEGNMFHVRCFGHILNLIVKDGIDEVSDSITRIRDCVKYVRSSPSRFQTFKKCSEVEKIKSIRSVCLDVQTRWNATYFMLGAALEYEKAFDRLEEQDGNFANELKNGPPTESDWLHAKNLHLFLERFYVITKRVSGSKYVTSNSYFQEVIGIQTLLQKWSKSESPFFSDMAKKMTEKFEKYCNIDKINILLIIAVVLDPRYKLGYVKYCFASFCLNSKVEELIGKIKDVMDRLYQNYASIELAKGVEYPKTNLNVEIDDLEGADSILDENKRNWRKYLKVEQSEVIKSDLERYLQDVVEDESPNFDILEWWKIKTSSYRVLSNMARDILAIPISTVASESAFSTGGRVLDSFRSSLTPRIVECLICAQDWLRSSSTPVDIEEKLEELEDLEKSLENQVGASTTEEGESPSKI